MTYRPKLARRRKTPASLLSARRSISARTCGSRSFAIRSGTGRPRTVAPAGDQVQRAEGAERHVHRGEDRHGQRDDPAAGLAGALARHRAGAARARGRTASMVRTFQFRGRPAAALISTNRSISVVAELVEAARDDRLELGALVLADGLGQREEFGGLGVPGGDGLAVAVGVGGGLGGGQAPGAGVHRVVEEPQHLRPAARRSAARRRRPAPMTYRRSAQWPTMKPGVDGDPALQGVQVLAEGVPGPGRRPPPARPATCPRPWTSCGGCSRRPRGGPG